MSVGLFNDLIPGIVFHVFKKYDYLLSEKELNDVIAYVNMKAEGKYDRFSDPYMCLLRDEVSQYVFRKRITEISCASI